MGTTNNLKETNINLKLAGLECSQCSQKFTQEEIDNRNYELEFDTTNDIGLVPMSELKDTTYYFPFDRTGYQLIIWIRHIVHEDWPWHWIIIKQYEE